MAHMVLEDRTPEGLLIKMLNEVCEMLGGAEMMARRLRERDVPEVDTAIQLLGGLPRAANRLGMSKSNLWKMLQKAPLDWNARWVKALSDKSKVPVAVLLDSPPSELVKKLPELRVVANSGTVDTEPRSKPKRGRKMP